jgi:hypothetical protein
MNETLLGCPHCAKPVRYAAAMAGQVVACPHCRGPFQMPDRPPASQPTQQAAPPPPPPGPSRPRQTHLTDDPGLAFGDEPAASGASVRAELDSYRSADFLATVFALLGSLGVLIVLGLTIYTFVLPVFRGGDDRPGQVVPGLLWLVSSFVFAGLFIVGLFMIRACVLVGVDAARTLRSQERDSAARPR